MSLPNADIDGRRRRAPATGAGGGHATRKERIKYDRRAAADGGSAGQAKNGEQR